MSNLLSVLGFAGPFTRGRRNIRGFTLVELLVVIAIISVLATLLLLQLGVARAKARDAKRIADINQVRSGLELFFDDNGSYPATMVLGGAGVGSLVPAYLVNLPVDPLVGASCTTNTYDGLAVSNQNCYGYEWRPLAGPTSMQVWAELEQRNRNALENDTDISSIGWAGSGAEVNGANDTACTSGAAVDCVYDVGQP